MKKNILSAVIMLALVFSFLVGFKSVEAKTVSVKGYYKPSTMKYVAPSYRTSPNKTKLDNYSTKGNYNPYTGKSGTANPYKW
jgi:hypothetical protein